MRKTVASLLMAALLPAIAHAQNNPITAPVQPPPGSAYLPIQVDHQDNLNYTSFPLHQKRNLAAWEKYNDKNEYNHPEFGILPDGAPCDNCVELLAKRKESERYFQDLTDTSKLYIQRSLGNINLSEQGRLVSMSSKLHAEAPGSYASGHSPEPVSIDIPSQEISIHTLSGKVSFNRWSLWAKINGRLQKLASPDWTNYTIGEDGMYIKDLFNGIDAEFRVLSGAVKTNLIIKSNRYGAYSELIFRDEFNQGNGTTITFTNNPSRKKGTGGLTVSMGGNDALRIGQAIAFPKGAGKDKAFALRYELDARGMNILVPAAWINANIKNHQLVIDPLVTATNTLAQSAIGSGQSSVASCGFSNYCSYPLSVTQPAATTITGVATTFSYLASGLCSYSDGAFAIVMGSCSWPGPGTVAYCGASGQGACGISNYGMLSSFSTCLPAPSCNPQILSFQLWLFRTCKGISGCDGTCIGAATPYTVTLTCHTVEFAVPAAGSAITITGDTCQGQGALNAQVTGYGGVPPYSYSWSVNAGGTPVYATGNTTTFNYPTAGSYPVYATVSDACGNSFTASKTIMIDPPKFGTANITICANQLPYTWNGQTIAAGGTAVATYTTPSLLTGCDSTTTLNLTVNALPAITTQPVNATTLVNGSANFTIAASGTGPLTYQWQVNTGSGFTTITDGGVYSNSTTASLTISNATLSMNGYSYQCIVSGVCTPAATSNSAVLTVNLNPQTVSAPFANGSTVVLTYGDAAVSAAATASSGLPVTYSSSDATVATIDATGGITITGAGTTQITVSQSGNDTYLAAATSFTVQVNKKDLLITANDITRPYGESNPPLTMQYSGFVYGQNPSVITPPLLSTAVVTTTLPGAYLIALAGGSAANYNLVLNNGTFTVTGAEVNINKQPDDNSACAGQEAAFKTGATAVSPLVTLGYQWQQSTNGSGWQDISGATADTCIVSNSNSLYVRCLVTAPGTNLYTQAALFTVNPLPAVQAAKSNDLDCNRGSADLMASGAVNYTWSPATGLSNPHIANPVATPAGDMTYIVTGTDDHGCRNTDSIQVKVTTIREGENVMANAFTPNGDGNNDCFGIRYWGAVQSIQFDVYNRYGALVFHSTTPGACWDGRSGGQDQPAGTYVYFIHAVTQCGVINRKGTVTLIR